MADLNSMKKDAKITQEPQEFPNGHVYAFVKGKKHFFALDRVMIEKHNMTVGELVDKVKLLEERIEKLKLVNLEMLQKIQDLEGKVKLWIG